MKTHFFSRSVGASTLLLALAAWASVSLSAQTLPMPGSEAPAPWTVGDDDGGMSSWIPDGGRKKAGCFRIEDGSPKGGSSLWTPAVAVKPGELVEIKVGARLVGGDGIAIYVMAIDGSGKANDMQKEPGGFTMIGSKEWKDITASFVVPPDTVQLKLWIHSFGKALVTAEIDGVSFRAMSEKDFGPRWAPQYKIKPGEKSRLTEADVVGPDGIVYPNWSHVGVPGGIPNVPEKVRLAVKPGDDLALPLEEAAAKMNGPGAISIPEGKFRLSRPVRFEKSGLVIRGAGMGKTHINFDYGIGADEVRFYNLKDGQEIGNLQTLEIHVAPEGLTNLGFFLGNERITSTTYMAAHWGLTYSHRISPRTVTKRTGYGPQKVTAKAFYSDGRVLENSMTLVFKDADTGRQAMQYNGAFSFSGISSGPGLTNILLAKDGARGSRTLALPAGHGFQAGDHLRLQAPATKRWNELVKNAAPWGTYRENLYRVEAATDVSVTVSEPLRLDFPVVDGSYVVKLIPIERVGVENLTLEQTKNIWTSGIIFQHAFGAWVKGVKVVKAGQFPFYMPQTKYGEVRDSEFHDAWWKGGGGTAYAGFETSYDCLMTGIRTSALRHAPNFNWSSSGCVIRDSVFEGSDGQWHCGWANENLLENISVASGTAGGGYGYGLFTTSPSDSAHGPIGPRNVVYQCKVTSPKDGFILSGMNEGWIIAYNHFTVEKGRAITAQEFSFDHQVVGNLFEIRDLSAPAIRLSTPDCGGWEITGNRFKGVTADKYVGGMGKPLVLKDNVDAGEDLSMPKAPVPSIFLWQKEQGKK